MAEAAKAKARKAARRAQSDFEQANQKLEQRREARKAAFEQARSAGLSTREIAEATGLHFTRVARILQSNREDFDGETLQVRRTAHEGQILEGTKTDHGEPDAGRVVPVPATLARMLEAQINLNGPDGELLFTTPRGRLWRERTFYRDLWKPAQEASGLDIRPPSAATATSRIFGLPASTMRIWPRSRGIEWRRCLRDIPMLWDRASDRFELPSAEAGL